MDMSRNQPACAASDPCDQSMTADLFLRQEPNEEEDEEDDEDGGKKDDDDGDEDEGYSE
jgi:hypothetical protein